MPSGHVAFALVAGGALAWLAPRPGSDWRGRLACVHRYQHAQHRQPLLPAPGPVTVRAPGSVWTPLIPSTIPADRVSGFGQNTPLGRPAQPAEVAARIRAARVRRGQLRVGRLRSGHGRTSDNLTRALGRTLAVSLNFERSGGGEPLILLHGIGGELCVWEPVLEPLARRMDVIAVDLPGFGRSPALSEAVTPTHSPWPTRSRV